MPSWVAVSSVCSNCRWNRWHALVPLCPHNGGANVSSPERWGPRRNWIKACRRASSEPQVERQAESNKSPTRSDVDCMKTTALNTDCLLQVIWSRLGQNLVLFCYIPSRSILHWFRPFTRKKQTFSDLTNRIIFQSWIVRHLIWNY